VVDTFPTVQSPGHQHLLLAARRLYDQGRFLEAAQAIRPALRDEADNPFVLNEYARALFRVDSLRLESGRVYERLGEILTKQQSPPPGTLVVDMWFIDAHWKLALLYLDIEEYGKALIELTKVALSRPSSREAREQLYSYLAEAFYFLGDKTAAQWFVEKTLQLNPRNEYVLAFRSH
jgi:tetratricopeptide (TPR) repeat protein